ncbi:ATP-NAD kinase [Candidatus Micrarchaeota archaeon CG10_big_fil_rev_8_21_14_0_10_59_7]|nr:MAG: ATP-NAD kinase [Candidatus Micrarchaeota archaeon CG10_big_fil_rev_8_21_14_0_10_59_7]
MNAPTRVGIAGRVENPLATKTADRIWNFLRKEGIKTEVQKGFLKKTNAREIGEFDADLVLSFGGDGTLLHVFRELGERSVPVLGINCGELGFLTDVDYGMIEAHITNVVKGQYYIEPRARLDFSMDSERLPPALNEGVIVPSKPLTMLRYGLNINQEYLWRDNADALIIATPTGTTGHALSAGGPVVNYNARVIAVVPMNSTNQASRPLIVPEDATVTAYDINSASPPELVIDGQVRMKCGSEVSAKHSKHSALLARVYASSYAAPRKIRKKTETAEMEILKAAPPSSKFIFRLLEFEGPLTQKEIIAATMLPARTVRRGLEYLIGRGVLVKKPFLGDPRQSLYAISR